MNPPGQAPQQLLIKGNRKFETPISKTGCSLFDLSAPRSPWQSPYVERLIGSVRRECLDHIVVINEESLRAMLRSYFSYYHDSRCHLGLNKDSPELREVQSPEKGRIVEIPKVGGLHHRYERRAA
jgi:putative transposase